MASAIQSTLINERVYAEPHKRNGYDARTEAELLDRWRNYSDMPARQALVKAYLPRVEAIARGYRHYPVDHEDLVAEGTVGLITAIDRFEADKNVRLMTYASHWIRAYIVNAVIKNWGRGKTGMGITRSRMFFKVRRTRAQFSSQHADQEVIVRKMAQDVGVSENRMRDMIHALDTPDFSLDAYAEASGQPDLADRIVDTRKVPDEALASDENEVTYRQAVARALAVLDDRERLIASQRLMNDDPMTLADLGREIGVSRERARQLELRAKRKLARALAESGITERSFFESVS